MLCTVTHKYPGPEFTFVRWKQVPCYGVVKSSKLLRTGTVMTLVAVTARYTEREHVTQQCMV